jgi:hypothetical protein
MADLESGIKKIETLNFDYLEKRLVEKLEWSENFAKEAARRYKNFLIMLYKYPKQVWPPPSDIDEVWHAHILHTKEYFRDCEEIFGRYIHHAPFQKKGNPEADAKMRDFHYSACELYTKEFQEPYSLNLEIESFW